MFRVIPAAFTEPDPSMIATQERAMAHQTEHHHVSVGVFIERGLIALAIIGVVIVVIVGFL